GRGVKSDLIFELVTSKCAEVLRLYEGEGLLCAGSIADLIAVPDSGLSPAETLAQLATSEIELVLVGGGPQLLSQFMRERFDPVKDARFESLKVNGTKRYVRAPVAKLLDEARTHLGTHIRLGGKSIDA